MVYDLYRQCPANHYSYVIRSGDTLYGIAYRFNVGMEGILASNPGLAPNNLRIGQTLCIPVCPPDHAVGIIEPGDTLYKIAQAHNISLSSLLASNPGIDPNRLVVGQRICIPVVCPSGNTSYTVRSGDSMYSIAVKHSVTVQALINANPQIPDPNALIVGQKLCVPASDPILQELYTMTLDEKIGQMLIVGFDGYAVNEPVRSMIRNYHVGGIILYSYNVESPSQLLALVNTLKSVNSVNRIPLFISVDEEGGRVSRMPAALKKFPSNAVIGSKNNGELSYKIGYTLARVIRAFGFNMDFAPVLDINSNPANPVIGDRSFGANPQIVSELGVQTMKGIQAGGVIPVIKHFPGHGDTSVDSHVGLPVVNNDLNRLKSFELVPFAEAVRNGADAVMVAHILLNKIDPANPSSLSRTIITDILRNQLHFTGVVITDDMTMGAIVQNYDLGNAAVKAVNAGSDIVLVSRGYENEVKVFNALKNAVQNGTIPGQRVNDSVYRILRLKRKYRLNDAATPSVDVNKINNEISAVLQQI